MTAQQLVGLGIRLFSVWLAISSARYLSSVPLYLSSIGDIAEKVYQAYTIAAAYLAAALLLWFFPMSVAHKIIPRSRFVDVLHPESWVMARVGCALLGLWLLAKSLLAVAGNLLWLYFYDAPVTAMETYARIDFLVSVFELAFSLILIWRADDFAKLLTSRKGENATHGRL